MFIIVGYFLKFLDDFIVLLFIDMNLELFLDRFEGISEVVSKEYFFEKVMDKMMIEWDFMEFVIFFYRESGIYILFLVDDI